MTDGALFDGRGCLTPAGLAALQSAPVGGAPPELAAHLASCPRCQQEMLATELAGRSRHPTAAPKKPHPMRTLYLLVAVLLAGAALLISTYALLRDRLTP